MLSADRSEIELRSLLSRSLDIPSGVADHRPSLASGARPATRLRFPDDDFESAIDDLIRAPWLGEVSAILTGYFGSPRQPAAVAGLVRAAKERNPQLTYVCDPVMGDLGDCTYPSKPQLPSAIT